MRPIPKDNVNILFTCAGRRVAMMNAFRAALAQVGRAGRLIATDITKASPAFHEADKGMIVPPVRSTEYMPALLDIVAKNAVSLLVPMTDLDLRSLSRHADRFRQMGCEVMVGSEEAVQTCRDKRRTRQLLLDAGLAAITTLTLEEFQAAPFYPCFIKPVSGSASFGTALLHNERQLQSHVRTYGEVMLVQEYVPGQEYTIDVYRTRSGAIRCIVPRQRLVVRTGEVEKAVTVKDPQLIDATARLADCLKDLWGVYCCQCRRQPGRDPQFFEINPRFGGGSVLSIAAGANLPLFLLQDVLNLPFDPRPVDDFTDRLLMLRYDSACFVHVDTTDDLPGFDSPIIH